MNRVILIGNGFDLAHGLNTKYNDFIDDYWERKSELFLKLYREGNLKFRTQGTDPLFDYAEIDIIITNLRYNPNLQIIDEPERKGYERFHYLTMGIPATQKRTFTFKNKFLEQIIDKKNINYWIDIEEEYYLALNECLNDSSDNNIRQLNNEFLLIKKSLEEYLKTQSAIKVKKNEEIAKKIYWYSSKDNTVSVLGQDNLDNFLYLNFNYTSIEKIYTYPANKIIHIHGELDNPKNPIIFGYGDEIGEKYKLIEEKNNNDYLDNMKTIKYSETRNYREMLNFINSDVFQVFIMGHSCGISDRTLLNTIFEHDNCHSIKIFYHKRNDGTDNFSDIIKNISRNFTKKSLLRERLIHKEDSEPLL